VQGHRNNQQELDIMDSERLIVAQPRLDAHQQLPQPIPVGVVRACGDPLTIVVRATVERASSPDVAMVPQPPTAPSARVG